MRILHIINHTLEVADEDLEEKSNISGISFLFNLAIKEGVSITIKYTDALCYITVTEAASAATGTVGAGSAGISCWTGAGTGTETGSEVGSGKRSGGLRVIWLRLSMVTSHRPERSWNTPDFSSRVIKVSR